jgi:hypothetical protein
MYPWAVIRPRLPGVEKISVPDRPEAQVAQIVEAAERRLRNLSIETIQQIDMNRSGRGEIAFVG